MNANNVSSYLKTGEIGVRETEEEHKKRHEEERIKQLGTEKKRQDLVYKSASRVNPYRSKTQEKEAGSPVLKPPTSSGKAKVRVLPTTEEEAARPALAPQESNHDHHHHHEEIGGFKLTPPGVTKQKIGRNDPCWCGSGKKFKKCHYPELPN